MYTIPVKDSALVAEQEALKQLVGVGFDKHWVHLAVLWHISVHVLLEVHSEKLENEIELSLLHQNILQRDNVGMLQLLQQWDLADCCRRHLVKNIPWNGLHFTCQDSHPFILRFESNLLHGHNLIGPLVASLKVGQFNFFFTQKWHL